MKWFLGKECSCQMTRVAQEGPGLKSHKRQKGNFGEFNARPRELAT